MGWSDTSDDSSDDNSDDNSNDNSDNNSEEEDNLTQILLDEEEESRCKAEALILERSGVDII